MFASHDVIAQLISKVVETQKPVYSTGNGGGFSTYYIVEKYGTAITFAWKLRKTTNLILHF